MPASKPLTFEAAMAHTGNPFAIDADGDATLRLQVPAQFVKVLADRLDQLFGVTFVVSITGLDSTVDRSR